MPPHKHTQLTKKKKILFSTLIPIGVIGVALSIALPLTIKSKSSIQGPEGLLFTGKMVINSINDVDKFLEKYAQSSPEKDFSGTQKASDINISDYTTPEMGKYVSEHANCQVVMNSMLTMVELSAKNSEIKFETEIEAKNIKKSGFDGQITLTNKLWGSSGRFLYTETYSVSFASTNHKDANGIVLTITNNEIPSPIQSPFYFSNATWGGGFNLTYNYGIFDNNIMYWAGKTISMQLPVPITITTVDDDTETTYAFAFTLSDKDWPRTTFKDLNQLITNWNPGN